MAALGVLTGCAHAQARKQKKIQACIDAHPRKARDTEWEASCLELGRSVSTCDSSRFISRDAAICIARVDGLRRRTDALGAHLWFGEKADPAWNVYTKKARRLVWIRGAGLMMLDQGLEVDARTGEPTRPPPHRKRLNG